MSPSILADGLNRLILSSKARGFAVGLHVVGGPAWTLNGGMAFHAASLMKIAVMVQAFQSGRNFTQPVHIENRFRSLLDQTGFSLTADDDSDPEIYRQVGQTLPLGDLVERMICRSSNLATNLLIELLDVESVRATLRALGVDGMQVLRGVEDQKAFVAGLNNTVTATALLRLLSLIAEDSVVSAEASREMIQLLSRQQFNEGIPAGLTPENRVAHKTGWTGLLYHDAGIIYPPEARPYALVVLTDGLGYEGGGPKLVSELARLVETWTRSQPASR